MRLIVLSMVLIGCEKPAIHALEERVDTLDGADAGAGPTLLTEQVSAMEQTLQEQTQALDEALESITALTLRRLPKRVLWKSFVDLRRIRERCFGRPRLHPWRILQ